MEHLPRNPSLEAFAASLRDLARSARPTLGHAADGSPRRPGNDERKVRS